MSRAEVSPEEMMDVAKQLAKGGSLKDQNYGDGSGSTSYGQDGSAGQDQCTEGAQQQNSCGGDTQHQVYQQQVEPQGYSSGHSDSYAGSAGRTDNNAVDTQGSTNQNNQFSSQSMPQDTQQGLQASGQGFGQGFDEGFGQGLSGGPNGSAPHPGIEVTEQSGPGFASRDADLHRTGSARGGGYETHQHHRDTFETKSLIQG